MNDLVERRLVKLLRVQSSDDDLADNDVQLLTIGDYRAFVVAHAQRNEFALVLVGLLDIDLLGSWSRPTHA
ncbi:hypothetical protein [Cryobacterium gelidum]|uniref:Uncharacterized protein n=1 Tax=Cryobacterium gelidum TaxID=1259164 RepID=A0A4R9AU76_9MICO|nr:hypothetical protein [Cryobacterium gelidum]TFD69974.1 hypothetical protein E3T50_11870 [Cryobacterium gelidum]